MIKEIVLCGGKCMLFGDFGKFFKDIKGID